MGSLNLCVSPFFLSISVWFLMYSTPLVASSQPLSYVL